MDPVLRKMENLFSLQGKVAVVTGGAGLLGKHFCSVMASYGAKVVALDLTTNAKGPFPEGWEQHTQSGQIKLMKGDITRREDLERVLSEISQMWGAPDILINNAAIDSPPDAPVSENGPFETYPEASLDKVLDVNIKGTWIACQVFGGAMAKAGKGSIINIASTYGLVSPVQDIYEYKRRAGQEWYKPAAYATTKSAVLNLTRYLATYWAKKGVRVNTLTPAGIYLSQDENFLQEYTKRIPIGRMAKPEELNGAVVYLASNASSYVTGSNLVVDGGWTAW